MSNVNQAVFIVALGASGAFGSAVSGQSDAGVRTPGDGFTVTSATNSNGLSQCNNNKKTISECTALCGQLLVEATNAHNESQNATDQATKDKWGGVKWQKHNAYWKCVAIDCEVEATCDDIMAVCGDDVGCQHALVGYPGDDAHRRCYEIPENLSNACTDDKCRQHYFNALFSGEHQRWKMFNTYFKCLKEDCDTDASCGDVQKVCQWKGRDSVDLSCKDALTGYTGHAEDRMCVL